MGLIHCLYIYYIALISLLTSYKLPPHGKISIINERNFNRRYTRRRSPEYYTRRRNPDSHRAGGILLLITCAGGTLTITRAGGILLLTRAGGILSPITRAFSGFLRKPTLVPASHPSQPATRISADCHISLRAHLRATNQ